MEDDDDDEADENEEDNNDDNTHPMEDDQQFDGHGDWLGDTLRQHPSDNQGWGKWQYTGWTSQRSSYMPPPLSQSNNSKVMELLRNMQIHHQNFSTLQEERLWLCRINFRFKVTILPLLQLSKRNCT